LTAQANFQEAPFSDAGFSMPPNTQPTKNRQHKIAQKHTRKIEKYERKIEMIFRKNISRLSGCTTIRGITQTR
jgi:hypothetical protein